MHIVLCVRHLGIYFMLQEFARTFVICKIISMSHLGPSFEIQGSTSKVQNPSFEKFKVWNPQFEIQGSKTKFVLKWKSRFYEIQIFGIRIF
uniref:Uncharacterized protein n=1 Tax=Octopus bimaculoides TaxID=37653 RepID=A0A0L8HZ92_OCTBM